MGRSGAIRALKKFASGQLEIEDAQEFIDRSGFVESIHRSTAIIHATKLEEMLELYLRYRLRRLQKSEREALFGIERPLGSFSAKIKLGYALFLYGPKTRDDLEMIREIRNAFAHCEKEIDFNTPVINECCKFLTTCDRETNSSGGEGGGTPTKDL